ncbi:hypothetical protein BJ165DRAFT_767670 [Panaeolus papilionaceus]|nr:hypothetical protein BJ165DRAFT_767670 [Panaeolus papilionaceus]
MLITPIDARGDQECDRCFRPFTGLTSVVIMFIPFHIGLIFILNIFPCSLPTPYSRQNSPSPQNLSFTFAHPGMPNIVAHLRILQRSPPLSGDRRKKVCCWEREARRTSRMLSAVERCYTCGGVGHQGDDCDDTRVPPNDHSAFSAYNVMKTPFWDPTIEKQNNKTKSATKPIHVDDYVNEQWLGDALDQVGRKGRVEASQKREERGEDDWFGSRRNVNASGDVKEKAAPPNAQRSLKKKMRFGFS